MNVRCRAAAEAAAGAVPRMKAAAAAVTAAENNPDKKELRLRVHDCFIFEQSKKQVNQNKNHGFYSRFAGVFLCFP